MDGKIAKCISSPGIDFSTRNHHTFLGKYICHSSGEIPRENCAVRNFASGYYHKPLDRLSNLRFHLCSESLMHLGENLLGFRTKGEELRSFGDLGTSFIATWDNQITFIFISINSSNFCIHVFVLFLSFKPCILQFDTLSHASRLSTTWSLGAANDWAKRFVSGFKSNMSKRYVSYV